MPVEELPRYICDGTRPNGRRCGTVLFEGWVDKGYLFIVCHRCRQGRTIESWPPAPYTGSSVQTVDKAAIAI